MKISFKLLLMFLTVGLFSCENYLEPLSEGDRLSEEQLLHNPAFLEGLLIKTYTALPNNYNNFDLDVASDNAVTNLQGSEISKMATGAWSSSNDPISKWDTAFVQIRHLNLFLDRVDLINWSFDPRLSPEENNEKNKYYKIRLKGEAYGLRAYFQSLLLQFHSGKGTDGRILGFPVVTKPMDISDYTELPRNTFAECVKQIMSDLDSAIAFLPAVYKDISGQNMYNAASGVKYDNRMNGNAARALKSRVALLAASPAFADGSGVTWADAAIISGSLLKDLGVLEPSGKTFYNYATYAAPPRIKEVIWEQAVVQSRTAETNNFPPSLYGSGRTNPTQSLVDAFPMKNGYPINHELSQYNASQPYALRDSRLDDYILYNGSTFKSKVINTYVGADQDGVTSYETSTRTGYYLKKFMIPSVSLTPGSLVSATHTYTIFRLTEVLLNYAEAANEAWGPTGDPSGLGFTAKTKIAELRTRAGIAAADPYLVAVNDQTSLRELIKNERRCELCFEGFRFWDIRRWNDATVNIMKPATGVLIYNNEGIYTYNYVDVEARNYQDYMIYGPIPYIETMKYRIIQNVGW